MVLSDKGILLSALYEQKETTEREETTKVPSIVDERIWWTLRDHLLQHGSHKNSCTLVTLVVVARGPSFGAAKPEKLVRS